MAKNKFYAVKIGRKPGIYLTWEECEANIKGYKSSLFKAFATKAEAEEYMNKEIVEEEARTEVDYDVLVSASLKSGRLVAFTDGGYNGKSEMAGYGVYILEPQGAKAIEISDIVKTDKFKDSNNITPELMAVITAFDWAISSGYEKITVFHDLEGVGKWGRKEWKAKAEIVKWYVRKLEDTYNDILDIEYIWVRGHSGITYNEEADRLATEAINKNTKPQFKMSETYFSCQNVVEKDVFEIIEKIKKNDEIVIETNKNVDGKTIYSLNYRKEKLTVTYFRNNTRTLVQGTPNSLFSLFMSYYTEKISDFELVTAYANMHRKRIEFEDINAQTLKLNLPDDFPKDAIKLVKQALTEKIALSSKLKSHEAYDYSHYIFPACRALEGNLKYLFEKCGIHLSEKGIVGSYFDKDTTGQYILKGTQFDNNVFKDKLQNSYNVYYRYRNPLGHFGELLNNDDLDTTTLIIESVDEAISMIDEILEIIKFD